MLGLWLEFGDLVSTLGAYRASSKTLLTDGSSFVRPPIHTHTDTHTHPSLLYLTTPYCLRTCSEVSCLGRGKSQHAVGTSNNENQKTGPQGVGKRHGSKMPSLNPASISTMGMVTISPKT